MEKELAIQGHPTRGKEVIQILESLGGNNLYIMTGSTPDCAYYINSDYNIDGNPLEYVNQIYQVYTLEEFEKEFPFKVGDKVKVLKSGKVFTIANMLWDDGVYDMEYYNFDDVEYYNAEELTKFTDEMIEYKVEEETKPKFKVGDKIKLKSKLLDDIFDVIGYESEGYRITNISNGLIYFMSYSIEHYYELVEEETNDYEKCGLCGLIRNSTRCLFMDNCPHNKQKNIFEIPEGCVLKDENGNEILTSKIILEKKKKEYPKTYEDCCVALEYIPHTDNVIGYKWDILQSLQKLIICRNAYWKIAGEEMGLDKPWEPDWDEQTDKFTISNKCNKIYLNNTAWYAQVLSFPTAKMRDAFYENFKKDIEECKELI